MRPSPTTGIQSRAEQCIQFCAGNSPPRRVVFPTNRYLDAGSYGELHGEFIVVLFNTTKAFYLLTGKSITTKGSPSQQIAAMRDILEDEVPRGWLEDERMKDYDGAAHSDVTTLKTSLATLLRKADLVPAFAFIKGCLRLDPEKRLSATEASRHEWMEEITRYY